MNGKQRRATAFMRIGIKRNGRLRVVSSLVATGHGPIATADRRLVETPLWEGRSALMVMAARSLRPGLSRVAAMTTACVAPPMPVFERLLGIRPAMTIGR